MTKHAQHLPYLDGWRGLAICLLLAGHFFPVPGINLGTAGVNLFFVLSGFLMARLLFVDQVPIPRFYQRRASRIFPAVFCFLALVVAGYLALGMPVSWTEFAAAAAFLINYFPGSPGQAIMPFGHIWSLCVEEHSYILLSLVAIAARAGIVSAGVATGSLAVSFAAAGAYYGLTYPGQHLEFDRMIHSEVSAFGIFVSAFLLLLFKRMPGERQARFLVPTLVGAGLALHWWSVPAAVRTIFGVGAFALAINLLAGAGPVLHKALSFNPLRLLGQWSFSIYLWQQPFYLYVHRQGVSPWIGLTMAVLTGIGSFYLLEKPARDYLNRRLAAPGDIGAIRAEIA